MAKIDTENLVIHGVGSAYLIGTNGSAVKLGTLQDMTIEVSSSTEDVFGGDGLYPIFNYIKEKSATFKFKNATFDLGLLGASQGVDVTAGGFAFGNEALVVAASKTLAITTGVEVESVAVVCDGVILTRVAGTPSAGEYTVTTAGAMTFNTAEVGKTADVSYVYTTTDGSTLDVLTTSVPGYVELRHTSQPTELPDGKNVILSTRIYKARCEGSLSVNQARGEASAPELSFKSVDPKRTDKKFVSYSVTYVD